MAVVDVGLLDESLNRYLTYALSVVSGRALPDVRDGLKPVQRRILYAMYHNLRLSPDKAYRKSAAVVGEVLARYHPHGDSACYDAMVRMAQDFSLRYPLVDGQGNFGSLDGDSAAAYRYTEARLTALALEVVGDLGEDTIAERENFDQTVLEPVVLPSRVPNLLINGGAGIAVGLATSIPPHNLGEVVKGLLLLLDNPKATDGQLLTAIKGPDFPTACSILNTKKELREIYKTGRGAIRMQGDYALQSGSRGKQFIIVTSVPYGIDKSALVANIADLIIAKKVPQLTDVRDESTDEIRIVLELASGGDSEKAMAYLFKHTSLKSNFNVNLTALIPTKNPLSCKPALLSLREVLQHFVDFRLDVTRRKLIYEKTKLEERIHLLEGLMIIYDALDEAIKIVRKSDGRSDAAKRLQKRFKLTEIQAFFIVDLRIYQLSKTNIEEVTQELKEKQARVKEINRILKNKKALVKIVADDLKRVSDTYGDKRLSKVVNDFEEIEFDSEDYVQHEEVHVIVTKDGWLKRIRQSNDPQNTRVREGDSLFFVQEASTRDLLVVFTSHGNMFATQVAELVTTSGFGEPVQKRFRFADREQIIACRVIPADEKVDGSKELCLFSRAGLGLRLPYDVLAETKRNGKRLMKLKPEDRMIGVFMPETDSVLTVTKDGYALLFMKEQIPQLSNAGKGVILQKLPRGDELVAVCSVKKREKVRVVVQKEKIREIDVSAMTIGDRAKRGLKLVKRGLPVVGLAGE